MHDIYPGTVLSGMDSCVLPLWTAVVPVLGNPEQLELADGRGGCHNGHVVCAIHSFRECNDSETLGRCQ